MKDLWYHSMYSVAYVLNPKLGHNTKFLEEEHIIKYLKLVLTTVEGSLTLASMLSMVRKFLNLIPSPIQTNGNTRLLLAADCSQTVHFCSSVCLRMRAFQGCCMPASVEPILRVPGPSWHAGGSKGDGFCGLLGIWRGVPGFRHGRLCHEV